MFSLKKLVAHTSSRLKTATITSARRSMGAGSNNMPVPRSMQAKFGGDHPPIPWLRFNMAVAYAGTLILIFQFNYMVPDCFADTWAQQEAYARLKLKEEYGYKAKWGVHYQDIVKEQGENPAFWDAHADRGATMRANDSSSSDTTVEGMFVYCMERFCRLACFVKHILININSINEEGAVEDDDDF
jgi:hypothetical protein